VKQSSEVLTHHEASGVYLLTRALQVSELEKIARTQGLAFFHVEGADIRSKEEFLNKSALALRFPEYFGHNWDALQDCLTDMSWVEAKGYMVLYDRCEQFAERSPQEFATVLEIFKESAEFWRTQGKPWFVVLQGDFQENWGLPSINL
jgi:RNAse (barnase) inhibitor barstar